MIRFRYTQQTQPAAPFVYVTVHSPDDTRKSREAPAQVDTGAARTVLPAQIISDLGLEQLDEILAEGLGGHVSSLPTYLLQIEIRQLVPVTVEAAASPDEPFLLLGRDVLNHFRLLLDGPQGVLEIS